MGESERYMENRGRGRYAPGLHFNINSPLVLLICINITAYLLITLLNFGNTIGDTALAPFFYGKMHSFLVPANPATTLSQPWSIITYSFFHFRFLTLLSNMIWLFGLGSILQSIAGNKMTVPIYLYGAVAGAFVFILSNAFLKGNISVIPLQGSNTALLAIAIAVTTLEPRYRLFTQMGRGIPVWVLTAIYFAIDILGIGPLGAPYYLAHLAGGLTGFFFINSWRKGIDPGGWMNRFYDWLMNLFTPGKKKYIAPIKETVFYNAGPRSPYKKSTNITQERIDEILDKISQKGLEFLSKEEKDILKKASED